jgi:hypothetical protein
MGLGRHKYLNLAFVFFAAVCGKNGPRLKRHGYGLRGAVTRWRSEGQASPPLLG